LVFQQLKLFVFERIFKRFEFLVQRFVKIELFIQQLFQFVPPVE
jgi:hypothetical protein